MLGKPNTTRQWVTRGVSALALASVWLVPDVAHAQEPAACLSSNPAAWPAPSKPYFMIGLDTSGSMISGVATSNSCGYPNTRMGHAKCAIKNMVQAYSGEVKFGLAQFASFMTGCGAACYGNTSNNPQPGCDINCYNAELVQFGSCAACGPMDNVANPATARGGRVLVGLSPDTLPPPPSNVPSIVQWVDNNCTSNNEATNVPQDGLQYGLTPLNGLLRDMLRYYQTGWSNPDNPGETYPTPLSAADPACRPVNVILLTDGDETCDSQADANNAAAALYNTGATFGGKTFRIKTRVINFAGGNQTNTDQLADMGDDGIDNNSTTSYFATNETQLSQALAAIIAGAIKPEVCDNTDNNCNGCTDEGYTHYCNVQPGSCCSWNTLAQKTTCGAAACKCCNWTSAAQRNTCLSQYQSSINAGNPNGDLTLLPCTTPAQQAAPANWLCYDPKDVCDNVDNNCASGVDENQTKCGSPLHCPIPETCNGLDDNCDGILDNSTGVPFSACPGNCQPSSEICDGCDNDCDGVADEGIPAVPCGSTPPANCAGTMSCVSSGQSVPVGGCVGAGVPKGFGACNANPQSEICDSLDNDCDGTVDEGIPAVTCTIPGQPGLVYQDTFPPSQCKKGVLPCNGTCTGWIGPSAELCDGIDNDCDGVVDDNVPGTGNVCGSDTGACSKGTTACVGGVLLCQGGTQPQPESCNGIDDDCDGATDDAPLTDQPAQPGCWNLPPTGCNPLCTHQNLSWCPPPGGTCKTTGTLSTPCQTGSLQCDGTNKWKCVGGKLPGPEVCDGTDNDCDTQTDESLGPPVGTQCGTDVGECDFGANVCSAGTIECQGGQGPVPEICNGKDDDCDGTLDNGIPIGGSCFPVYDTTLYPGARDKGECKPGVNQCDPGGSGSLICVGGVGPSPEICDGKDNDCDGFVDEPGAAPDGIDGTANPIDPTQHIGDVCGVNVGSCKQGALSCDAGKFVCLGSVGPSPEICDCADNDCDGVIDETPVTDSGEPNLCSPGKSCVEAAAGVCQCAQPCQGELCPGGTACKNVPKSGTSTTGNYCVSDPCGDCSKKTVTNQQTGDIECAPSGNVPVCICKGNLGCKSPCEGVQCPTGQACAPSGPAAGTCQPENNCYFFGCPTGEACNGGVCVDDPCEPNPCASDEVCKPNAAFTEPRCVGSCAGVSCPSAEECVEGDCTATGCPTDCPSGEVCSPGADAGTCGPDKCTTDAGLPCSNGAYCDPETGACGNDPCTGVKCPSAQECVLGECQWAPEGGLGGAGGTGGSGGSGGSDAGTDASTGGSGGGGGSGAEAGASEKGVWGLATGGGGCACSAVGERRSGPFALAFVLGAIALGWSRRASRRGGKVS